MQSLIYESAATGHRPEFIAHLMKYIISQPQLYKTYTFILNQRLKDVLGDLCNSAAFNIRFLEFSKRYSNSFERGFEEWKEVSKVISEEKEETFNEIIFLDIDPYLFLLTTKQFKKLNLSVRGILYQPYFHFKENNSGLLFYVRHVLRSYVLQKYSTFANPNIQKIYIQNDRKCIDNMNRSIKNIFHLIPDPIDNEIKKPEPEVVERIISKYAIRRDKKNLLLFGAIDNRKNLINILKALIQLPPTEKKNIHLIVAGKFNADLREKYLALLNKSAEEISIAYYDEFVSDEEREVLFQNSDLILMMYINYYSSSGVLGHSLKYNKNVIASNAGLVGRIVTENKLGVTVNPLDENEIKGAILKILKDNDSYLYNANTLLEENNPVNFSKILLQA